MEITLSDVEEYVKKNIPSAQLFRVESTDRIFPDKTSCEPKQEGLLIVV